MTNTRKKYAKELSTKINKELKDLECQMLDLKYK